MNFIILLFMDMKMVIEDMLAWNFVLRYSVSLCHFEIAMEMLAWILHFDI